MSKVVKRLLIGLGVIIGLAALVVGGFFGARFIDTLNPYSHMNTQEYLASVGTWKREDADLVIWKFNKDGTGQITVNGGEKYYDTTWYIDADHLIVNTVWLYEKNDSYPLTIDKEKTTFTIDEGTEEEPKPITFVKTE